MKFKKTLVMVLAACMVVGMLAGTAFADVNYDWMSRQTAVTPKPDEYMGVAGAPVFEVWGYDEKGNWVCFEVITELTTDYTGWLEYGDNWTYYRDGELQRHWQLIDGYWYYFNTQGLMVQRGVAWVENRLYYFDDLGRCDTTPGLKTIPNYFYVHENDNKQAFFPTEGVAYFYLNQNGVIETGWNWFDGAWHMTDKLTGRLLCNEWYRGEGGIWYYFDEFTEMATGWMTVRDEFKTDKTYYFNSAGALQYGWLNLNGKWYYLNPNDGAARIENSWAFIDGFWYLFDKDGVMQTGWQAVMTKAAQKEDKDKGTKASPAEYKWYYLTSWGNMVYGEQYINGQLYDFGNNGQLYRMYSATYDSAGREIPGWKYFTENAFDATWYLTPGESDKDKSDLPSVILV